MKIQIKRCKDCNEIIQVDDYNYLNFWSKHLGHRILTSEVEHEE